MYPLSFLLWPSCLSRVLPATMDSYLFFWNYKPKQTLSFIVTFGCSAYYSSKKVTELPTTPSQLLPLLGLVLSYRHAFCVAHWGLASLVKEWASWAASVATPLKKTASRSQHLGCSSLEGGAHYPLTHPWWNSEGLNLLPAMCRQSQLLCVRDHNSHVLPWYSLHPPGLPFFSIFSRVSPKSHRWWGRCPFRADHPACSCSQHFDGLCISALTLTHHRRKCL